MFFKQFTLCILLLFVSVAFAGPATVVGRTFTRKETFFQSPSPVIFRLQL